MKRTLETHMHYEGLAQNQVEVVKAGVKRWGHVVPISYRQIYFETRSDCLNAQVEYTERYRVATISFHPEWHTRDGLEQDILHEFLHLRLAPLTWFTQDYFKREPLKSIFEDRMEEVVESLMYLLSEGL